jgi:UDP-N-acetylmuramyl tripeptide synthase
MNLRLILAVLVAKTAMFLSRFSGRGRGSSLPGMLALRIYPGLLKHYRHQARRGVIMITGTNGKTTTSNMLSGVLVRAGYTVVANREGANLLTGVTTAFIRAGSVTARVRCDYAVLEVDEAAFPVVTHWIKPGLVVITNFFRDQLDRYGELDTTIGKVLKAIQKLPPSTRLILNADDPLVARFAGETGYPSRFYGVRPVPELAGDAVYSREAKFCPLCGAEFIYSIYLYSQLGDYKCPRCGFARPRPDIEASFVQVGSNGTTARVDGGERDWKIELPVQGMYNLYNALAAFTASLVLGVDPEAALAGLKMYSPATGRMELFAYGDKKVTLTLVKNPTGFNQALAGLIAGKPGQDVMIAINDNDADGRDISWLWDVDFEILAQHLDKFNFFICTGKRAEEMALRLKYAGVPVSALHIERDYQRAIDGVLNGRGAAAGLLATYTALWPVEKILARRAERVIYNDSNRVSPVS